MDPIRRLTRASEKWRDVLDLSNKKAVVDLLAGIDWVNNRGKTVGEFCEMRDRLSVMTLPVLRLKLSLILGIDAGSPDDSFYAALDTGYPRPPKG